MRCYLIPIQDAIRVPFQSKDQREEVAALSDCKWRPGDVRFEAAVSVPCSMLNSSSMIRRYARQQSPPRGTAACLDFPALTRSFMWAVDGDPPLSPSELSRTAEQTSSHDQAMWADRDVGPARTEPNHRSRREAARVRCHTVNETEGPSSEWCLGTMVRQRLEPPRTLAPSDFPRC